MIYFSVYVATINNMDYPLLLCWNNIFPNGKMSKLCTAVKWVSRSPGKL